MTIDAYCLKCKTTRTIATADEHVNARGTRMAQGPCPVCGTTVTKFLPKADAGSAPTAAVTAAASTPATNRTTSGTGTAPSAPAARAKRGAKHGA